MKKLWFVEKSGTLRMIPVRTGVSDGSNTEIMDGNVAEGMSVLTGSAPAPNAPNPRPSNGGGPPGPMM